jgi:transposase InsO family protein
VIELRAKLTADGLDAGPVTIAWHLEQEGARAPAPATISRILTRAGLVSPQPRKRPRSSYLRFEMAQPNEMWQSDFIHWRLADGTEVEILNWLDDHSRCLLSCTAHQPVTGDTVATVFLGAIEEHGPPASTLTDNGSVYTSRFTGGRNALRIRPPTTRRQAEERIPRPSPNPGQDRAVPPDPATLAQGPADSPDAPRAPATARRVQAHYNERRPHRALHRRTPGEVYRATPKALPASNGHAPGHYRLRYDRLDPKGRMTIRRAGRMHHLGIGTAHARKRVLAFADDHQITVADLATGEVLSVHHIDPNKSYWRNQKRQPGRWPSPHN